MSSAARKSGHSVQVYVSRISLYILIAILCQACDTSRSKGKEACDSDKLLTASETGELAVFETCATFLSNINPANDSKLTALTIARTNGHLDVINYIKSFELSRWKELGNALTVDEFYRALDNDSDKIVEAFIVAGTSYHRESVEGIPPIVYAIFQDSQDVVQALLDSGLDPDQEFDNRPLICIASMFNQQTIVASLLLAGADVNKIEGAGQTAIMFAAKDGYLELTKFLVLSGADVAVQDKNGDSALDLAVRNNQQEVVDYLKSLN